MTPRLGVGPQSLEGKFATLKKDVTLQIYAGYWEGMKPVMKQREVPAGSTVKIVMHSRFGDVGITDDLTADYGYGARLDPAELADIRDEA